MVYPDWLAEAAIAVVGTVMFLGYLGLGAWLAPKILRLFTTEKAQEFKEAKQGTWRDAVMGAIFVSVFKSPIAVTMITATLFTATLIPAATIAVITSLMITYAVPLIPKAEAKS